MLLTTRKTHYFIEIKPCELEFRNFAEDKQEREKLIENLEDVIEDLKSYDE